jgi:hypothetical protein
MKYAIALTREKLVIERALVEVDADNRTQAEQLAPRMPAAWVVVEEEYSVPEFSITIGPIMPLVLAPMVQYVALELVMPDVIVGG